MNIIFSWLGELFDARNYTLRNFAAFLLVLFCIQYIPIESRAGVSWVKVCASAMSLFVFVMYTLKITKVSMLFVVYYAFVLIAALLNPQNLRWSSVLYLGSFLILYVTFYNLITIERVFSADFFIDLLKGLIVCYFVTLVIQQVFLFVGIKVFPLINLVQIIDRGIGANSLSYEPSSAARVLGVAYLALLRMFEVRYKRNLSLTEIYHEAKWPTIGFVWCMLTMGSGTAIIALGILLLYFIKRKYIVSLIPAVFLLFILVEQIDYKSLNRALNGVDVFLSMDTDLARETDTSAATRIAPLINTLTKLDISDASTWFGHGVDSGAGWNYGERIKNRLIGGIYEYGLLSFIVMQIIIYSGVIRRFFSLESLFWIFLCGMSFGNIPYTWGIMMIFGTVRFFQNQEAVE